MQACTEETPWVSYSPTLQQLPTVTLWVKLIPSLGGTELWGWDSMTSLPLGSHIYKEATVKSLYKSKLLCWHHFQNQKFQFCWSALFRLFALAIRVWCSSNVTLIGVVSAYLSEPRGFFLPSALYVFLPSLWIPLLLYACLLPYQVYFYSLPSSVVWQPTFIFKCCIKNKHSSWDIEIRWADVENGSMLSLRATQLTCALALPPGSRPKGGRPKFQQTLAVTLSIATWSHKVNRWVGSQLP